jgi:hypothetical protein
MAQTTPLGVRISLETKDALARAASADMRSVASFVEKVLVDHLRATGFLPVPDASLPVVRRSRAPVAAPDVAEQERLRREADAMAREARLASLKASSRRTRPAD